MMTALNFDVYARQRDTTTIAKFFFSISSNKVSGILPTFTATDADVNLESTTHHGFTA